MNKYLCIPIIFFCVFGYSQTPSNDDCVSSINIASVDNYCSDDAEYSNLGGTIDPPFNDICFINYQNAVWFSFVPSEPAIIVRLLSGGAFGTLEDPKMALFTGDCNNLQYISCSPGRARFEDEFTVSGLTIGQRYYLLVAFL